MTLNVIIFRHISGRGNYLLETGFPIQVASYHQSHQLLTDGTHVKMKPDSFPIVKLFSLSLKKKTVKCPCDLHWAELESALENTHVPSKLFNLLLK